MEFEKRRVAAAGCDLEYTEGGAGHALVFLHGGGGFRFDEPTFPELAKEYRVLIPSMPGFDGSSAGTTRQQRLVILEGGPHVLSAGVPDAFLRTVREFYK